MCNRYQTPFILDGITSIVVTSRLEAWNVEAAAMGAQKCTAGPSGIAAIAFNSRFYDRCKAIKEQGDINPLFYLDFVSAFKKGDDDQDPLDANYQPCNGLGCSIKCLERGLENRWNRCGDLAKGVRNLFLDLGFELLAEVSQRVLQ